MIAIAREDYKWLECLRLFVFLLQCIMLVVVASALFGYSQEEEEELQPADTNNESVQKFQLALAWYQLITGIVSVVVPYLFYTVLHQVEQLAVCLLILLTIIVLLLLNLLLAPLQALFCWNLKRD